MLANHFLYMLACLVSCQMLVGVACSSDTPKDSPGNAADVGDGGQDSSRDIDTSEDTTRVARLILSPDPVEIIVTQTIQINVRAYNSKGLELTGVRVAWQIEDAHIATVDESGFLSGLIAGQTTLVARHGDLQETVEVHVLPTDTIASIKIVPEQREIGVGERLELAIKAFHSNGMEIENLELPLDWQSDAPATASISADATLVGLKRGEVRISASLGGLEARADFRVELKFDTIECELGCFAISTEGKIYDIRFVDERPVNEEDRSVNSDGVWMPRIEQVEDDGDVRFKAAFGREFGASGSSCAISTEDRVYCWGRNNFGTIGVDFQTTYLETPTALDTELRFKALKLGQHSTCGLTLEGQLYCWGDLSIGAKWMHDGLPPDLEEGFSHEPVLMDEGRFEQLIMSWRTLCVQEQKTQRWRCMGMGSAGQLGNGTRIFQEQLVDVAAPGVFTQVSTAGNGNSMCGIDSNQQVWCWGSNTSGALGQPVEPDTTNLSVTPQRPAWDIPMVDINVSTSRRVCGATLERDIRCWGGSGEKCQLGQPDQGPSDPIYAPQAPIVGIPDDWKMMSGSCVLTEGGDIWCWALQKTTEDPLWPRACEPTAQRIHTFSLSH